MASLAIVVVLIMPFEKLTDRAVAHLVRTAYWSGSSERARRRIDLARMLLEWNPRCIPAFCQRHLREFQDKHELNTALSVALLMRSSYLSVAEAASWLLSADEVGAGGKYGACTLFTRHCSPTDIAAIRAVLKKLPTRLAVSFSSSLIPNLNRFEAGRRLEILRMGLEITGTDDLTERWYTSGAAMGEAKKNEQLFLDGIKQFPDRHHRVILMLALYELDRTKYERFQGDVEKLACTDELSKYFYEKYKGTYLTDDWMPEEMRKKVRAIRKKDNKGQQENNGPTKH